MAFLKVELETTCSNIRMTAAPEINHIRALGISTYSLRAVWDNRPIGIGIRLYSNAATYVYVFTRIYVYFTTIFNEDEVSSLDDASDNDFGGITIRTRTRTRTRSIRTNSYRVGISQFKCWSPTRRVFVITIIITRMCAYIYVYSLMATSR